MTTRDERQLAGIKAAYGGGPEPVINFNDSKWRFDERVKRLMQKWGFTKEEAEAIVHKVILEKELTTGV